MTQFFENLLTASFHGSIVIAVVLLLRPLLRKAPRKFVCLLWLMAGLRLLVPIEISSPASLQPEPITNMPAVVAEQGYVPGFVPEFMFPEAPRQEEPVTRLPQTSEIREPEAPAPEAAPETAPQAVKQPIDWMKAAAWTWAAGMGLIGLVSIGSYFVLRRRVREAIRVKPGIWVCDRISTAFIFGYIRPRIYIPMGISRETCRHILAHERTHLEKGDHWFKLIGFFALAVHWFNPLVWVAYVLLCKDIEIACDERVVQFMEIEERKRYSAALVACSARHAHFTICPVAFGEVSVKERVHRVLKYKKPSFWISLVAVAALAFVAVCFLTSPKESPELTPETTEETTAEQTVPQVVAAPEHDLSDLPENVDQEEYVDPHGHGLQLYVYGEKPTGAKIGLSMGFDPSIDYDARSKQGRGMTFTEEYWIEQDVDGSWQKLKTGIEPSFGSLIYNLGEQHYEAIVDWTDLYGELYDGHFRLGKNLEIDGETVTYYGEFWIMDNDPIKEPEVHLTIDRIHAALDEIKSRECVHVVTLYDGVSEVGGEGSSQNDMIWSGSDYIQTSDDSKFYGSSGKHLSARYNGISYTEYEGQWYSAGDAQPYFAGEGWDYSQRLNGYHVTVNGQGSILDSKENLITGKVSLTLDAVSNGTYQRIFRDYYFDDQGLLTQINSTTYYRSNGQLYKHHNVSEIYPAEKSELTTKLEAVKSNAGNHTADEYDQLMREKSFDEDFSLGAGSFVWRQGDWAYRIGGEEGSATATGMMIYHEYCGGESQGNIYTQGGFWIEKLENEKWSRVPMPAGNPQPSSDPKLIFDNTNGLTNPTRMRCDWTDSYGTLAPGFYRVAQNYKLTAGGQENIKTCYAKFRVYDPNMEVYLSQVRQGLTDLLNRDSYYLETMKDFYGVGNWEENEHDVRLEKTWKRDNQNFLTEYIRTKTGEHGGYSLLLNGKGYGGSAEEGWKFIGHFDREFFEFWHIYYDMYDSYISTVEKDGNVITVNQDVTEYKRKFIYTFDDAGNLVEGQSYLLQGDSLSLEEGPVLTDEFKVTDVTAEELDRMFAKCDITKPATFSFAEDEKLFANYDNWKTSGFVNTSPVTISSAQEAEERAKNDCTLHVLEDENGFHEGGWNLVKAFFDPDAQLWKVEFTMSQGGVYQAVYMTADGVTTNVIS